MPCTRKINGDGPILSTAIPYWDQKTGCSVRRVPEDTVLSIDEVLIRRREVDPAGQCSLHIACQKNSSIEIINLLVKASNPLLRQADDGGNIPLMIAIKHGSDVSTIEFLVESDVETLFFRNLLGETPLYMAVEYACATVISLLNGTSRFLLRGGHPRQVAYDENALRVVNFLICADPRVLNMPDVVRGSTPLHAMASHCGPGRLETLRAIIESVRCSACLCEQQQRKATICLTNITCKQTQYDKRTPLHLASVADHLSFELVPVLAMANPDSISMVDSLGRTPLHLLCNPCPSKSCVNQMLLDRQEDLTGLIEFLCRMNSEALKIKDQSGKLPLHHYLESALIPAKRPEVLLTMFELYPESIWEPHPTLGSVTRFVTSSALASSQSLKLTLDYESRGCQSNEAEENKDEDPDSIVDPHLLCLFVLLNHWHMHGLSREKGKILADEALAAVSNFLSNTPLATLQERLCGNSIRCTIRLIVHALFQVEYRESILPHDDYPVGNLFLQNLIPELIAIGPSRHLCTLSQRVKFLIRNDASLVTMSVLLPFLDSSIFFTMFPTWTPAWFSGSLRICPVFLSFGFTKWCVDHDIPNSFNLPLAAEALQLPNRQTLLPNAERTVKFFKENHESFEASLVQAIGTFAQTLIESGDDDEQDPAEQCVATEA